METLNAVGVGLSGASGTGNFAGNNSPSLTTPRINQINDINGNSSLSFPATSSAVNYLSVGNSAAAAPVFIQALGSDPSVSISYVTKNTGSHNLYTNATTGQLLVLSGAAYANSTQFNFPAATVNFTYPSTSGTILVSGNAINSVPSITFSSTSGIIGTTTNDNAAAGSVGQYLSSNVPLTPGTNITSNTATNLTSLSLTAGDWDVSGNITFQGSSAISIIAWAVMVNTVSATLPADGSNYVLNTGTSTTFAGGTCITTRVSIASTTTVYLIGYVTLSGVTTCVMGGNISARRVR